MVLTYSGIQKVIKYEAMFSSHNGPKSSFFTKGQNDKAKHGIFYRSLETPEGDIAMQVFRCRHCTLYDIAKEQKKNK
jgi:hypothetical protein